ncbi:MAG: Npun_F0813 family protein [Prochlorothrix sp.]
MFILKRQDVEISNIQHPKRDQKIPILSYQGQTFRLVNVFSAAQAEEARAFWRELTDNQGKACVLLEEPERFSIWGKVVLEQLHEEGGDGGTKGIFFVQAVLLLLQTVYFDVEDLLGGRQVSAFEKDVIDIFKQWHFPQTDSREAVNQLLTGDPLAATNLPEWQEHHLNTMLQELHRIGRAYFGNDSFVERAMDALQDMPDGERNQFLTWLNQSPLGKLWASG